MLCQFNIFLLTVHSWSPVQLILCNPREEWRSFWVSYLANKQNGEYQFLDCSHYVHSILYKQIYEESINFINRLK